MSRKDREATEDKLKLLILKVQEKKDSSYINQMQVCLKRVKYKFSKVGHCALHTFKRYTFVMQSSEATSR